MAVASSEEDAAGPVKEGLEGGLWSSGAGEVKG